LKIPQCVWKQIMSCICTRICTCTNIDIVHATGCQIESRNISYRKIFSGSPSIVLL